MKPKFRKIYQIGMVVRDVDSCVKRFEEDYGMGPWEISVMSNELPYLNNMTIDGKPSDLKLKSAILRAYGMDFAYLDLREELGLIVECDSQNKKDYPGHNF